LVVDVELLRVVAKCGSVVGVELPHVAAKSGSIIGVKLPRVVVKCGSVIGVEVPRAASKSGSVSVEHPRDAFHWCYLVHIDRSFNTGGNLAFNMKRDCV
jgi:hypothetical protein